MLNHLQNFINLLAHQPHLKDLKAHTCFPSKCFQSGSVRDIGICSVLCHWVQVNFVSISELKIQFTPTKMRGWCSGENLEEGSEAEIEFQALRIDFSPPLWCFLLMVLSI